MTTIVCTSDLHEHLVDIPACDLLLIAGDVSFAFYRDRWTFPQRAADTEAPGLARPPAI